MLTKKINDIQIKPLKTKFDDKLYKHSKLFNKPYPLIYICARRGWGKTSLIYNILNNCAIKRRNNLSTQIHYFSNTNYNDNVFNEMINKFEKHNFEFIVHDDITINDDPNFSNEIEKLYWDSKKLVEENYEQLKKFKYNYPLYIFIFDDFWKYMKLKIMSQLCKQSRHTRTMLIYSSQYLHDLP